MHVCIVQRNVYDDIATAKKLVQNLRTNSVVLVVDSDDGFGEIDPTHPEHTTHQSRLQAYTYLLDEADQVWFSTEELKNSHPKIADKTYVVKNSIDKRVWGNGGSTSVPKDQPIQLLYMGTATHSADFAMILPALDAVAKKQPGSFVLNVIGVADDLPNLPWINRIVPEKGSMYPKFVQWFTDNNAFDVGLSPLVNSAFNRHKSDIKCLDYIAAGLLPVVSDVLPYQSPELDDLIVRVKNTKKDWEHALLELMKNKDATRQRAAKIIIQGQKYLQQKRTSDKTGKILLKRIEGLLED